MRWILKARRNEVKIWRLFIQRIQGRRYISENYFLRGDTDTVLIPPKYPDIRTFTFGNIILRFLSMVASGTDILVVSMLICQNQGLNSGRKNLKQMLKEMMLLGWNCRIRELSAWLCGSVQLRE